MEKITEFLKTIKSPWKELLAAIVGAIVAISSVSVTASCGTTRAVIRTSADNTQSSISITTNNPTNVSVSNGKDSLGFKFSPNK